VKPIILVASKLRRKDPPAVTGQSEPWLTVQQVADHLQVHRETVLRGVRMRKIPHIVLPGGGQDYRFMRPVIDEWGRQRALGKQK
jgi:excisionase family DNA binding protein